ncbi:MAG: hypothetical protein CSB48_10290 [Proteobacteria bacterium]|nr:MAG: hypothetical protein CSB48_10290 [Pseudomonadota bacterium]
MKNKQVSIVLATKNARPMLEKAMLSLMEQTWQQFEVVVIDGASTDGTLDYLKEVPLNLRVISEPDSGISDAYSKALKNARGDIVGIFSTDERYYPNTIETAVRWFEQHPGHIVCGGICTFLNDQEKPVDQYQDDYLALERHLSCEHICSISSSFFNRSLLKDELHYLPDYKTCCDYELWARLALKYPSDRFEWFDKPVVKALRAQVSMSFRDDTFRQMVDDKIHYLHHFHRQFGNHPNLSDINLDRCQAGIHMWAAEQLAFINYQSEEIFFHCEKALQLAPDYQRIHHFIRKHGLLKLENGNIVQRAGKPVSAGRTLCHFSRKTMLLHHDSALSDTDPMHLITHSGAWGYSLELCFDPEEIDTLLPPDSCWIQISIEVIKGAIGIGSLLENRDIAQERILRAAPELVEVFIPVDHPEKKQSLMIRSGGEGKSEALIHVITVVAQE